MNTFRFVFLFARRAVIAFALCALLLPLGCATVQGPRSAGPGFPEKPTLRPAGGPEEALAQSGTRLREGCSVSGGWGFERADACVLAVPGSRQRKNHNTVPLERYLVLYRNEQEFSRTPPAGRRYRVTDYGTVSRTLSTKDGRMYSVWRGQVCLLPEDYAASGARPGHAGAQARIVQREYWFDITETSKSNSGAAAIGSARRAEAGY